MKLMTLGTALVMIGFLASNVSSVQLDPDTDLETRDLIEEHLYRMYHRDYDAGISSRADTEDALLARNLGCIEAYLEFIFNLSGPSVEGTIGGSSTKHWLFVGPTWAKIKKWAMSAIKEDYPGVNLDQVYFNCGDSDTPCEQAACGTWQPVIATIPV